MNNKTEKKKKQNKILHDLILGIGAINRTRERVIRAKNDDNFGNPEISVDEWNVLSTYLLETDLMLRYMANKLEKLEEKEN